MRADAQEAEKIKNDLSQLRKEIEMADLEDEETYRKQNNSRVLMSQEASLKDDILSANHEDINSKNPMTLSPQIMHHLEPNDQI